MRKFKKFSGNYIEAVNVLGLPKAYYGKQTLEAYNAQVNRDLHRQCYLSFTETVDDMKEKYRDTSHLNEDTLSYTQGNFEGGVFIDSQIKASPKYFEVSALSCIEETTVNIIDSLRIAYIDDDGNYCALAIGYIRDDPDPAKKQAIIPVEQRKRLFSIAFIKNTTLAPAEREVTILSDSILMTEKQDERVTSIDGESIPDEINKLINSKNLSELLKGLFNEDSISLEKFNELSDRFVNNLNIDNRDLKKKQLEDLNKLISTMFPDDEDIQQYIDNINQQATTDINFFKTGQYEKKIEEIYNKINSQIERLSDQQMKEAFLLKNKLTYFAINLDLNACKKSSDKEDEILLTLFQEQAKNFRTLRDNPNGRENRFLDMNLSEMNKYLDNQVYKRQKVNNFISTCKRKCDNDQEALEYLKTIENSLTKDIGSYTDDSLNLEIAILAEHFDSFLTELEYNNSLILDKKVKGLIQKLEVYVSLMPEDTTEYLTRGLLNKVNELKSLSGKKAKAYRHLSFKQMLSATVEEIENKEFVTRLIRQVKDFSEKLRDKDPPFIKQGLLDRCEQLAQTSEHFADQIVEKYKKLDIKSIISSLTNDIFTEEEKKQISELKKTIVNEIKAVPIPSTPENKNKNFFQRNRFSLLIGGLATLIGAAVTAVLVLTGVLLPLAIVTGLFTVTTAVATGTTIADDEQDFKRKMRRYSNQCAAYDAQIKTINSRLVTSKNNLVGVLKQAKTDFLCSAFPESVALGSTLEPDQLRSLSVDPIETIIDKEDIVVEEPHISLDETDKILDQAEDSIKQGQQEAQSGLSQVVQLPIIHNQTSKSYKQIVDSSTEVEQEQTVTKNSM